jgi:uncharacterized Tic20 family protein
MAEYRFIGGDNREYGPYSAQKMRQLLAENRFNAQSQVRLDNGPFQSADSFPDIVADPGSNRPPTLGPPPLAMQRHWGMEENTFCMLMHISGFTGILVPLAGWVLPIVMWATEKEKSQKVDAHGRNIFNAMISGLIYLVAGIILTYFCIGLIVLLALAVGVIVIPIIAAVKANQGIVWKYPLAIPFFTVSAPRT